MSKFIIVLNKQFWKNHRVATTFVHHSPFCRICPRINILRVSPEFNGFNYFSLILHVFILHLFQPFLHSDDFSSLVESNRACFHIYTCGMDGISHQSSRGFADSIQFMPSTISKSCSSFETIKSISLVIPVSDTGVERTSPLVSAFSPSLNSKKVS